MAPCEDVRGEHRDSRNSPTIASHRIYSGGTPSVVASASADVRSVCVRCDLSTTNRKVGPRLAGLTRESQLLSHSNLIIRLGIKLRFAAGNAGADRLQFLLGLREVERVGRNGPVGE